LFYIFSYHIFDFSAKKNFGTLKPPHENFLRTPLARRAVLKAFLDLRGGTESVRRAAYVRRATILP